MSSDLRAAPLHTEEDGTPSAVKRWARWAIVAYVLVMAALTLTRTPDDGGLQAFYVLLRDVMSAVTAGRSEVSLREAEALANLVLFVPFGALLALAAPRLLLVALLVPTCLTSLGIELVQYLFLPARVPSALDVIMNSAGAAVGLVLGGDARRLVRRRP